PVTARPCLPDGRTAVRVAAATVRYHSSFGHHTTRGAAMARRLAVLVAATVLVGMSPATGVAHDRVGQPGEPGIGDPYFPHDGNGGYDVAHYDLDVQYDPATDVLTGAAAID